MAETASERGQPLDEALQPGVAATGDGAVVGQHLGNAIEMPAPTAAAKPTRNVVWASRVARAVANRGARVETEPSIMPASAGWTTLSTVCRSSAGLCNPVRASAVMGGDVAQVGAGEVEHAHTARRPVSWASAGHRPRCRSILGGGRL